MVPVSLTEERSQESALERVLKDIVQPSGYVRWEYFARQRLLARSIARSAGPGPLRVLDIGCGYGALALALHEAIGSHVAAMDILVERVTAVAVARRKRRDGLGGVDLVIADADRGLPFKSRSFDVVVASEVLEHLDAPQHALAEIYRVLRPGGRVLVTTPNAAALPYRILHYLPEPLVKWLAASLTQESLHPELLSRTPSHPDHHRREGFTLDELADLAHRSFLRMVAGFSYRIPLPDKLMGFIPAGLARRLAAWGTQRIPLGLQLYGEFMRADDVP